MTNVVQTRLESDARGAVPWAHFRIPPFPEVAIQVLKVSDNDGLSMCQICDFISSDPAFCSELLTVANSAAVPHRFPVTTVERAVALLGTHTLKGLCLTVAARSYLGVSISFGALRGLWVHSLASALIAQRLVGAGLTEDPTAYAASLLHEIGRFAFAVLKPEHYAQLLASHSGPPESILQYEREIYGCDYIEMGRHLMAEWKLPAEVALNHEKCIGDNQSRSDLAALVHLSCRIASSAGFPAFPGCEKMPYSDLLEELPPTVRRRFCSDVDLLASEIGDELKLLTDS